MSGPFFGIFLLFHCYILSRSPNIKSYNIQDSLPIDKQILFSIKVGNIAFRRRSNTVVINNLIQQMQALAAHLKRRNNKILEQQLSLPRIPQVVNNQFTKTSIRIKKAKPVIKYVSETTFSPEEEHIHEQIKMALHKPQTSVACQSSRILQLLKGVEPIREKKILPKIKDNTASVSRVQSPQHKASRNLSVRRKSKSVNHTKANLNNIFRDPNEFIKSYFAEINDRLKR